MLDRSGQFRVALLSESKHQGNDVRRIREGVKQGRINDQYLMVAGNEVKRVHKNRQEVRNLMLAELHFPYVVFLQGSNFATSSFFVDSPDGTRVPIARNSGRLNRIDRVTASSFGRKINQNYCQSILVEVNGMPQMLQIASLHFQCEPWGASEMERILQGIS